MISFFVELLGHSYYLCGRHLFFVGNEFGEFRATLNLTIHKWWRQTIELPHRDYYKFGTTRFPKDYLDIFATELGWSLGHGNDNDDDLYSPSLALQTLGALRATNSHAPSCSCTTCAASDFLETVVFPEFCDFVLELNKKLNKKLA